MSLNQGIDYGLGQTNMDKETGIRYGVISQWSLNPDVINDVVANGADYGSPHCPKCGEPARDSESDASGLPRSERMYEYNCLPCKKGYRTDEVFSDEMIGWSHESDGYVLSDCLDSDVMVIKSPYFTYAQYCSPCVPGACSLDSPLKHGAVKCYALGHDWFESGKAPYRLFNVSDGSEVFAQEANNV